jgi:hypothetical protein
MQGRWDLGFESTSLQRRVKSEPGFLFNGVRHARAIVTSWLMIQRARLVWTQMAKLNVRVPPQAAYPAPLAPCTLCRQALESCEPRNRTLSHVVAAREFGEGRALRPSLAASFCCASVNFGFRPMRCPRFCARLRPSAVRVRIRVAFHIRQANDQRHGVQDRGAARRGLPRRRSARKSTRRRGSAAGCNSGRRSRT